MNVKDQGALTMRVTEHVFGDAAVLDVDGRLTCLDADGVLERTVERLARHGVRTIVANLVNVSVMDAVGLGALVGAYRASAEQLITFRLVHVPRRIRRLIDITGLAAVLEMFDSLDAALGASQSASLMARDSCRC